MSEKSKIKRAKDQTPFSREIAAKVKRKLKAQRNVTQGVWFGLGMMGLIGWSVVVPTLLGAALGYLAGQSPSGTPFLDADAIGYGLVPRLSECLALGGQGRQSNARGTGG